MTARSPGLVGAVVASLVQCRCVAMTPGCRSSRCSSSPSRASRPAGRRRPTTSRTRRGRKGGSLRAVLPTPRAARCTPSVAAATTAPPTTETCGHSTWATDGSVPSGTEPPRQVPSTRHRRCVAAPLPGSPRRSGCWCSGDGTAAPTTAVCARSIRPPERGPTCARSERAVPVRRRGGPRSSSSIRCVSAPCCSAARAARTPTSSGRTTSSRRPGSGSPPPARSPAVAIRWSSTRAARWCGCSGALVRGPTSMTSGVSI